jgi:hypothetical protein
MIINCPKMEYLGVITQGITRIGQDPEVPRSRMAKIPRVPTPDPRSQDPKIRRDPRSGGIQDPGSQDPGSQDPGSQDPGWPRSRMAKIPRVPTPKIRRSPRSQDPKDLQILPMA